MKIRSLEELDDKISQETVWRKRELTTSLKRLQGSPDSQRVALRSGVLLLYAHWEGWVKNVAMLYLEYVRTQRLSYDELSEAFLGSALKSKFSEFERAFEPTTHNNFARFLREGLDTRATFSSELIRTESNLSSKVFSDVLVRLGLPQRSQYLTRAHLIDEKLVGLRNSIAHGQYAKLEEKDFRQLQSDILELLELFTDDVKNAASTKSYLANSVCRVS